MTKQQREWMEYKLTQLYRENTRLERRMEKAEAESNAELYAKLDRKDYANAYQISLMIDILNCLNYNAKIDHERDRAIISKRER